MRTTRARARLPCPTRPPFRMASAPKARLAGEPTTLRPAGTSPASEPTPEQYGAARSLVGAFRTHGHLAARLDPLGTDPPGDPALEPSYHGLDQGVLERVPAALLSVAVPGESAGRGPAAPARDLLRPGRLPDRASELARPAPLAARRDRERSLRRAAARRRAQAAPDPPGAGRGVRALPASAPTSARSSSRSRAST